MIYKTEKQGRNRAIDLRLMKLSKKLESSPFSNRVKTKFSHESVDLSIDDEISEPSQLRFATSSANSIKSTQFPQAEIESDGASSSSSAIGSSSSYEDIVRLKNPISRPNYLKATSSSEKKKMNNQVTNLTDSESTTICSDFNKPVLQNTEKKSKTTPNFKRNTSMRTLRILLSKPKSCPQVPEGERVIRATCSSTLKDSKIPLVEVEPEERETQKISALRVCTYSYCSLHGHHNHSSTPPLKRLLSKRRRFSKTQKGIRAKTQFSTNDLINDANTRQLDGNEDTKGRKKWKTSKVVASNGEKRVIRDESISEPVGYDDVAKKNESGDGKNKRMSMWYLIHKQMVSGLAQKQENQETDIHKTGCENENPFSENKEMQNEDLEMRKTHATKMVREAIEKILLPEVPDQSPDEMSICSDAPQQELFVKQNPNEVLQREKAKNIAPKSWSNFKKLILLNKFVKELEKVKTIEPEKPTFLPTEQDEESKKVFLRGKGFDTKKSGEEWMLDYALQQAVSELAPTQKRKVELLIKAYETMVTPTDGEKSLLSFRKLKGISNERGHIEKVFVDDEEKKYSAFSDKESNVLVKGKANQGVIKDESNLSEQSQEGDDAMNNPIEDDNKQSLVASSYSETGTIEQFNKDEEVVNEDVNSMEAIPTVNQRKFSLIEPNSKKMDFTDVSPPSNPKLDLTIDSETENRIRTFKSRFTKRKNMSMWHLIHQQMVAGLEDEGKTNQNENKNEKAIQIRNENENESENEEVELQKVFAIKMVREAIEKILLPEVQDDQSTTSETVSENELIIEKKQDEDWGSQILNSFGSIQEEPTHYSTNKVMYDMSLTQEGALFSKTEKKETKLEKRTEKQAPKRWSNLKKWIVLQRFVKELEKVKDFKPKKPELLPLKLDPEGEKVRLRNQMMNEKRSTEEWMLDYALRKVVSELAPKQKKKVELLVKAFETVVPPTEEMKSPVTFPKSKRNEVDKLKNIFSPKIDDENKDSPISVQKSEVVAIASEGNVNKAIGFKSNVSQSEKQKHMKMWHLLCQHVVSDIAVKIESDDVSPRENPSVDQKRSDEDPTVEFSKNDAIKLVRDAIEDILVPDTQDDSSDTLSIASDISQDQELLEEKKPRNWDKLKKMILLKRSIKALEKARRLNLRAPRYHSLESGQEEEKVDLKHQLSDERKKAEEWMLDFAVQHIVTKLTPDRKRRVSMLVEAFEAVVPLPQI